MPLETKLTDVESAAKLINSGDKIIIGGNTLRSHPMALIRQLIRNETKDLDVIGYANGIDVDLLSAAGCIKSIATSYVGFGTLGLAPNFRKAVEAGKIEVFDYPELMERFWAAAFDMPFYPNTDLFGSDVLKCNKQLRIERTSAGNQYVAVPPARADVAILHASMADVYGNVLYQQHRLMTADEDIWYSRCAKRLIISVERIVDERYVIKNPHLNMIPRYRTTALVQCPFGAHPGAMDYFYDFDKEHLSRYLEAANSQDGFERYMQEYVYSVKDHSAYLEKVGPVEKLLRLQNSEVFFL